MVTGRNRDGFDCYIELKVNDWAFCLSDTLYIHLIFNSLFHTAPFTCENFNTGNALRELGHVIYMQRKGNDH